MPNFEMLNNVKHQDVMVMPDRSQALGDNLMFCLSFPFEFRDIQANFPIFFNKDPNTGKIFPIALMGFKQGENLFFKEGVWSASYAPAMLRRQPFLIGRQQTQGQENAVVSIDIDSPRISKDSGELLFLPQGGQTDYLKNVVQLLQDIDVGHKQNDMFVALLQELELLEPFSLNITLNDGSKNELVGLQTIHEERLAALTGDQLAKLHEKGVLMAIYLILASHSNLSHLVAAKNALLPKE